MIHAHLDATSTFIILILWIINKSFTQCWSVFACIIIVEYIQNKGRQNIGISYRISYRIEAKYRNIVSDAKFNIGPSLLCIMLRLHIVVPITFILKQSALQVSNDDCTNFHLRLTFRNLFFENK